MGKQKQIATSILAEALGIEADQVSDDAGIGLTPQWDSLAHMRIILALEDHLGKMLAPEMILRISNFSDVEECLSAT